MQRNNEYAGFHESSEAPGKFSIDELLNWRKLKILGLGSNRNVGKGSVQAWTRYVGQTFGSGWLVYGSYHIGKKLKLRHNLDVMHIEKNICENLIGTILNIIGKTKDTVKARLDLKDLGIKEELQLTEDGDSCEMPNARYTLSKEKKRHFVIF